MLRFDWLPLMERMTKQVAKPVYDYCSTCGHDITVADLYHPSTICNKNLLKNSKLVRAMKDKDARLRKSLSRLEYFRYFGELRMRG